MAESTPTEEPVVLPFCDARNNPDWFITLKTWPEYWDAVADGRKSFEVRKADRPYRVGAVLFLQRWEPDRGDFTYDETGHPKTIARRITYVLPGGQFGIDPDYVVMGVANVRNG